MLSGDIKKVCIVNFSASLHSKFFLRHLLVENVTIKAPRDTKITSAPESKMKENNS